MQASAPSASFLPVTFTPIAAAQSRNSGDLLLIPNVRQQNGVTYTVWQVVVKTAQLVRHRMNITQRSIIERHTGEELA